MCKVVALRSNKTGANHARQETGNSVLENANTFSIVPELLSGKVSVVTLASAIEESGVHTWDRFGRFVQKKSDKRIVTASRHGHNLEQWRARSL